MPAPGSPPDQPQYDSLLGGREGTSLKGLDHQCSGSQAAHSPACAKEIKAYTGLQEKLRTSGGQSDPACTDSAVEDGAAASNVPDQSVGHSSLAATSDPLRKEPAETTHEAPSLAVQSKVVAAAAHAAPHTIGKQALEARLGNGVDAAPDLQRAACNAEVIPEHEGRAASDVQHGAQDVVMASEPCGPPEPCGPQQDSGLAPVGQHGVSCSMNVDAELLPGGRDSQRGSPMQTDGDLLQACSTDGSQPAKSDQPAGGAASSQQKPCAGQPAKVSASDEVAADALVVGLMGLEPQAQAAQLAASNAALNNPDSTPATTAANVGEGVSDQAFLAQQPHRADSAAGHCTPSEDQAQAQQDPTRTEASNAQQNHVQDGHVSTCNSGDNIAAPAGDVDAEDAMPAGQDVQGKAPQSSAACEAGPAGDAVCKHAAGHEGESMTDSTNDDAPASHTPRACSESLHLGAPALSRPPLPAEKQGLPLPDDDTQPEASSSPERGIAPMAAYQPNVAVTHKNELPGDAPLGSCVHGAAEGADGKSATAAATAAAHAHDDCCLTDSRHLSVGRQSRVGAAALHDDGPIIPR